MKRSSFTAGEIAQLRALVREKQTADRGRQKVLRARMRAKGFYISDYGDYAGFTVSDLDDLIACGLITVTDEPDTPATDVETSPSPPGDAQPATELQRVGRHPFVRSVRQTSRPRPGRVPR